MAVYNLNRDTGGITVQLIDIDDLQKTEIEAIWQRVDQGAEAKISANAAWSFEGNGIRTRTTFVQAFQSLGLQFVELPNLLKTDESVQDLSGYLDGFYDIYIIRESNHLRLTEFASASTKPVVNAMSSQAHPCEVLTDAYYLRTQFKKLADLRILLSGPVTNVFQSWHSLARVLGLNIVHYCPKQYHLNEPTLGASIEYTDNLAGQFDVVVTDAWPKGFSDADFSLSIATLNALGKPLLLPTPPVTQGNELLFKVSSYQGFVGYKQKALLLPVQRALIAYMLDRC